MRPLVVFLALPAFLSSSPEGGRANGDSPGDVSARCDHLPLARGQVARANDNRTPAGIRRGDTLHLSLVISEARWYPEGDDGCALTVLALGEEGQAPSVPAPLIRVPAGTRIRLAIRNDARQALWVHGLHDRPSEPREGIELAADSTHHVVFTASSPGTYAYGATVLRSSPLRPIPPPPGPAGDWPAGDQMTGALIVDPPGVVDPSGDRVFVITRWTIRDPAGGILTRFAMAAVNGRSWPHTERLTYSVGDTVLWHVINGSAAPHPMHLHGFYFEVLNKGNWMRDTALARPRTVVTEALIAAQTMRMRWIPERVGNWLFHCHLLPHMHAQQRLDRMTPEAAGTIGGRGTVSRADHGAAPSHGNHAMEGMAGLILGVHVKPASESETVYESEPPRRMLRLFANRRPGMLEGGAPAFGFVLQENDRAPAADSVPIPGSTIILRRGEPVQITVFNRVEFPLSVHWHGLELESFYDGVGDWSGWASSVAPAIAPGDSFVVRLTPPRAGTYMYHVHGEGGHELASGMYGALIVLDGATALDTATDKILLVSDGGLARESPAFVNGTTTPRLTLTAGRPHRIRVIGIRSEFATDVTIMRGADTVRWRPLAIDGAELVGARTPLILAWRRVAPGTIADYELTPEHPGELTLQVTSGAIGVAPNLPGAFARTWTAPITVLPPQSASGSVPGVTQRDP